MPRMLKARGNNEHTMVMQKMAIMFTVFTCTYGKLAVRFFSSWQRSLKIANFYVPNDQYSRRSSGTRLSVDKVRIAK